MSVSTDGMVLWWDTRRLGEPVESLQLHDKSSEAVLGAVSLDYNPAVRAPQMITANCSSVLCLCCHGITTK